MSDIEMREAIDRLDTGLPAHPELAGIIAGGRRRRRRAQTVWAAAGLATVAGVAQVAFVAGTHHAASPAPAPAVASSVAPTDTVTQVNSAVTDAFPDAVAVPAPAFAEGTGEYAAEYGVTYEVEGLLRLGVHSQRASTLGALEPAEPHGRLVWIERSSPCWEKERGPEGCTTTRVGDLVVTVMQVQDKAEPNWSRTVLVQPFAADPTTGETWMVEVSAFVDSATWAEADAALPSVETLTDLALDERLVVPAQ